MRFKLLDLIIAIAIGAVAAVIAGVFLPPLNKIPLLIIQVAVGAVCYTLVSSALYRRLHWFPLLLPRCPNCHDSNRFYHSLSRDWPREKIKCANCQAVIELCMNPPNSEGLESDGVRFQLLWPYSFGGRWRRMQ